VGILPHFQAFFWSRVFPASKQNPRCPCILWLAFVRADNVGDRESGSELDFIGDSEI